MAFHSSKWRGRVAALFAMCGLVAVCGLSCGHVRRTAEQEAARIYDAERSGQDTGTTDDIRWVLGELRFLYGPVEDHGVISTALDPGLNTPSVRVAVKRRGTWYREQLLGDREGSRVKMKFLYLHGKLKNGQIEPLTDPGSIPKWRRGPLRKRE